MEIFEDKKSLLLEGIAGMLLTFCGLLWVLGGWSLASISGQLAPLIFTLVGIAVAWFASRWASRKVGLLLHPRPVLVFENEKLCLPMRSGSHHSRLREDLAKADHAKADRAQADNAEVLHIPYSDITHIQLRRRKHSLLLALAGPWVTHPSGFDVICIHRLCGKDELLALEDELKTALQHKLKTLLATL